MLEFIMVPLLFAIVTYGICTLFDMLIHRKERLKMVEKITEVDPSMLRGGFMPSLPEAGNSGRIGFLSLKIAMILIGIGAGLLCGFLITDNYGIDNPYNGVGSVIYGASVLLCGGFGLIVAFVIEVIMKNRDEKRK